MKRKLDANNVPTADTPLEAPDTTSSRPDDSFETFGFDTRLLQAISKQQYSKPTPVQAQAIPHALQGKDILAKSETGTGKTAAYALPIIQAILSRKTRDVKEKATFALVLVPSRELSDQVTRVFAEFASFCSKEVRALNLAQRVSDAVLSAKLQEMPEVVVSTPGRARQFVANGGLALENIRRLVIDEADLVLSYGHEDDVNELAQLLPKTIQTFLTSATLTPEVDQLKSVFCRDPVTIKIDTQEEKGEKVAQYVVKCAEDEKFLLVFVILKLKLVEGKCIVFVADVDRSYRLKLYLEQYGIKSCVLNAELPVNSRLHVVEEFNKGVYNILIAADETEVIGGVYRKSKKQISEENEVELTDEDEPAAKKQKVGKNGSKEFGVSRGIDFQNVAWVLNFDLPSSSKSYTHRIGRTARAGKSGTALSFVIPTDQFNKHKPTSHPSCRHDEKVLAKIIARQEKKGNKVKPYKFDMDQVSAFRYRMNDALRAVTRVAVREARAREIKQELIRSEKLRKHFEDNPEDLKHLRRTDGGALGGGGLVRVQSHLKHVPEYLMPEKGRSKEDKVGFVSINGDDKNKKRKRKGTFKKGGAHRKGKNDPLKSFKTGRKK